MSLGFIKVFPQVQGQRFVSLLFYPWVTEEALAALEFIRSHCIGPVLPLEQDGGKARLENNNEQTKIADFI